MKIKFILKLEGGLGNQLFQFAHVVALQKQHGGKVYLDKHAFTKKQSRSCALQQYKLNDSIVCDLNFFQTIVSYFYIFLNRLVSKKNWIYSKETYSSFVKKGLYKQFQVRYYDSLKKPSLPYNYIVGNWLSYKFFSGAEQDVKRNLVMKSKLPEKCNEMMEAIKNSESVCIHIRLGDYLAPQWKDKLFVCTPEYYSQAIERIKKEVANPRFFVFSNRHKDFEMIQSDYQLGDVTYVDMGNSDVEDLELMRNCKHFVMSNSTYSWWGQYLSENPNKIVVAPSRYNNFPQWDMSDIYQDNWTIIEV